jgi:hypothetical protein
MHATYPSHLILDLITLIIFNNCSNRSRAAEIQGFGNDVVKMFISEVHKCGIKWKFKYIELVAHMHADISLRNLAGRGRLRERC